MASTFIKTARSAIVPPQRSAFGQAADFIVGVIGRNAVFLPLAGSSAATFAYFLPQQIAKVTLAGQRGGTRLLDEHIPTWTAVDADVLFSGLGAAGRQAYQHFYLTFDFYFPALLSSLMLASLLSMLLRHRPRLRYLAGLPVVPYLFDVAENLNHLVMLRAWPDPPAFCWTVGPWFTFGKWTSLFAVLGVVALAALAALLASRSESRRR